MRMGSKKWRQAKRVTALELGKPQAEHLLETILIELQCIHQTMRDNAAYPRQVTVVEKQRGW